MKLFAIGDTHLPSTRNKDMERFGWKGHPEPLRAAWDAKVGADDFIILAGDLSWATRPNEAEGDLKWLDERPGKKVLLKGNHDYWWPDSRPKLDKALAPYKSFVGALHNSAVELGPWLIAGTRLWTAPEAPPMPGGEMGDEGADLTYVEREARRLQVSIDDAKKKKGIPIAAVHFPPRYVNGLDTAFSRVIEAWAPKICVYGHLHGELGIAAGFVGEKNGVKYVLASCDAAGFSPVLLDAC
ncbi:MAG: metallophosphoesterase [Myxococcaceae bacterium]|nr:metallophosphoesterase [Myxococcaceae bacterium]